MSYSCMSNDDLLEESNRLISEMVALALQGERLQKLPICKDMDEPTFQTIFRELIDKARLMQRKNSEMVAYARESIIELDSERNEISKHLKLLDVWRRRALARLGEVDALKKNLVSLIVAFDECSARFNDQLLMQKPSERAPEKPLPASIENVPPATIEKPLPNTIEELMASLHERRTRAKVEEKVEKD
jgi:hypothetical protein